MQIENHTPYPAMAWPCLNRDGRELVALIVKGTFAVPANGRPRAVEPGDQLPVAMADEYWGEPGRSPVKNESDLVYRKAAIDLILTGFAYAPQGAAKGRFSVGYSVGRHLQTAELVSSEKAARVGLHDMERREGTGASRADAAKPVGFGFFPKSEKPRVTYAGTYGDAWRRDVSPLLPRDFDERYFQAAFPGLVMAGTLKGDEAVAAIGVAADGAIRTSLPGETLTARAFVAGAMQTEALKLDTVILRAEERQLVLVWRWAVPVDGAYSRVRGFIVDSMLEARSG